MARKYEFRSNCFGLSMEICEEKLLIAAFVDIEGRVASEAWPHDFRQHFFTSGAGVAEMYIKSINAVRTRIGIDAIEFQETRPLDYCKLNDRPLKAKNRQGWHSDYRELDTADRVKWFYAAQTEIATLPLAYLPYEQQRRFERNNRFVDGSILSQREMSNRAMAVAQDTLVKDALALAPALALKERAIKQLRLVPIEADDTITAILSRLDPDLALEIANEFEDSPKIRQMLVVRSLEY